MAVLLAAPFINVLVCARRRALARRLWRGGRDRRGRGRGCRVALTVALFRTHRRRSARGCSRRSSPPSSAPPSSSACRSPRSSPTARCRASRPCNRDRLLALAPRSDSLVVVAGARRARRSRPRSPRSLRVGVAAARRGDRDCSRARFGDHAHRRRRRRQTRRAAAPLARGFRRAFAARVLRHKEWTLLRRDPWLVSQTLMQLLYLLPPALLLWRTFGDGTGASCCWCRCW